ncbi:class F sortase [Dactylosporangium sp. NPDC049742]|uniref:class F sortase n=1 Tax=Dactylosporangium sp. NPDC049742 TaxID=3154737 RepID=UPI00342CC13D
MRRSRAAAWAAVAAGIVTMLAATVTACAEQPPPPTGTPPTAATSPAPEASAAPAAPAAAVPPTGLKIDRLNLDAKVDAVGVDGKTGEFAVPPSVDVVGWYKWGPGANATAGSIVIAGHVDSAEQGRGAFFHLRDLGPGDPITLAGADGSTRRFTVTAREVYPKAKIPLERYFARDGAVRLTLITCGGPFDASTRHYRDNVVITAQPAA